MRGASRLCRLLQCDTIHSVAPAQAGAQFETQYGYKRWNWAPACAGATCEMNRTIRAAPRGLHHLHPRSTP